ncbi:LacI family DNA-binding transcriptional regulator [Salinimonas marina]|uniref:LacI family DNA-binding transcriptional regulator n=1 Tax=Salinimonas marina TaxID=2785918 RepID=A0A7S9HD54_9ALTE|nr:LacI family DNA-binding transcriptional regulator [Salinimonas marina]QPG05764.1 LacI family DNA-binding transcriptional regulator [Salinimonas marina]
MSKKNPRVTLQDIADAVGVTKMTVSRYLREPATVATNTRTRIADAIEELGYIKNRAPSMLARASSKTIGVVVSSLSNQVFSAVVQGIESVTRAHGFDTLLMHTGYDSATEEEKVAALLSYQIDALILTETEHTPLTRQMLRQADIPVVECMELPSQPLDMAVGLDHDAAAFAAVNQLIEAGCQDIAYFAARMDTRTQHRKNGYQRALQQAGLSEKIMQTTMSSSFSLGRELLNDALAQFETIDGIFCTNDDIAAGALLCAQEYGLRIPEDIRIIGYNQLDIGQALTPALASVVTPRFLMGQTSASLLLARLRNEVVEQPIVDVGFSIDAGGSL